eukprot:2361316-Pleurochrysis_carterae.AAC.1
MPFSCPIPARRYCTEFIIDVPDEMDGDTLSRAVNSFGTSVVAVVAGRASSMAQRASLLTIDARRVRRESDVHTGRRAEGQ